MVLNGEYFCHACQLIKEQKKALLNEYGSICVAVEFNCQKCSHKTKTMDSIPKEIQEIELHENSYFVEQGKHLEELELNPLEKLQQENVVDKEVNKMVSQKKSFKIKKKSVEHKCDKCRKQFSSSQSLNIHLLSMHSKLTCNHCEYVAEDKDNFKQHMKSKHRKIPNYLCTNCGKKFKFSSGLRSHKKGYWRKDKKSCQDRIIEKNEKLLALGKDNSTPQPPTQYNCKTCSYVAATKLSLSYHKNTRHVDLQCKYCDHQAQSSLRLKSHYISIHEEGIKEICDVCGKQFNTKGGLYKHRKEIHNPNPVLPCDLCEFKAQTKCILKNHKEKTHEKKNMICCSDCGKLFTHKSSLIYHELSFHKKRKDNFCDHCDYQATQIGTLNAHVKAKHTNQRYPCNNCGKLFGFKSALTSHIKGRYRKNKEPCQGPA